jgi:hypothetical protein
MSDPRVQLLTASNWDAEVLTRRLDETRIRVRTTAESVSLSLSLVNLLSRLFPAIHVEAPAVEVAVQPFGRGPMDELLNRVAASAQLMADADSHNHMITVDVGAQHPGADFYCVSDGWTMRLAPEPLDFVAGKGPATVAASALTCAEILRIVLPELAGVRLSSPFTWNMIDYGLTEAVSTVATGEVRATCFGAGSVGSSLLYTLLLSEAHGTLSFIDADRLSTRNKLRYPLLLGTSSARKAQWVTAMGAGSGLHVEGHDQTAAAYIRNLEQPLRLAISAVDNIPARRDIVDALAETVLNAGIDGMKLHVSRHGFGDGLACLYCPYVDAGEALDEVGMYQQLTGLPISRVKLLLSGWPLEEADVRALKSSGRIPADLPDELLIGGRLQDAARAGLYAQAPVNVGGADLAVSAPFVSALAGSILAAEVLKAAAGQSMLDRRVDVDCSGYPTGFLSRPPQDATGRCLCHSSFRLQEYAGMWGSD